MQHQKFPVKTEDTGPSGPACLIGRPTQLIHPALGSFSPSNTSTIIMQENTVLKSPLAQLLIINKGVSGNPVMRTISLESEI